MSLLHFGTSYHPAPYLPMITFLDSYKSKSGSIRLIDHVFNHQGVFTHELHNAVGLNNISSAAHRANEIMKEHGLEDIEIFCLPSAKGQAFSHQWYVGSKV